MSKKKFGRQTTALEVSEGMDLSDKTILITGANAGIGFETAKALAIHNAHVIMACRNVNAAQQQKSKILKENPNARIDVIYMDSSKLKTVESCAKEYLAKEWPLNVLILNAGVYDPPQKTTGDGFEYTFQVNHLAHFYLVQLLAPALMRSSPTRVVVVASRFHNYGTFNANDVTRNYLSPSNPLFPLAAYCRSKFCNVLFSKELQRRWNGKGITSNSLHPGVARSDINRNNVFTTLVFKLPFLGMDRIVNVEKAAATSVYCAVSHDVEGVGGEYFDRVKIAPANRKACNEETARRLWDLSEEMINKWKANLRDSSSY